MPNDWRTASDKLVCAGCRNEFMRSSDCLRCKEDAAAREWQEHWRNEAQLPFMGVNLAPALAHPMRALPIIARRNKSGQDSVRPESKS
jgi:hypothetical protein